MAHTPGEESLMKQWINRKKKKIQWDSRASQTELKTWAAEKGNASLGEAKRGIAGERGFLHRSAPARAQLVVSAPLLLKKNIN